MKEDVTVQTAADTKVWYPVNLDISGRLCLVVGGGAVAARKITSLLLSEAVVRVVSPEVCPKVRRLADEDRIEWVRRAFCDNDLDGAFLVFAATNAPQVQRQVAELARERKVLLNSAESPALSTFLVPARIRRGDFLLAVSTGGASPALSALIKRRLALQFGPEYGLLVRLMAALRHQVVGCAEQSTDNRELFHAVLALPILERIRERDWEGVRQLLLQVLPGHVDGNLLIDALDAQEIAGSGEER